MIRQYFIVAMICLFTLSGCQSAINIPIITYERTAQDSDDRLKIYNNVIYMPTLKAEYILDEELIKDASGYYIIDMPTQDKINSLVSDGYFIYQNEAGEVIIYV